MKCLLVIISTFFFFNSQASITFAAPAPVPQTGQTSCYNLSGYVTTCTGNGQDGEIQAGVAWPNPRFVDHGNGTAIDTLTGLMWTTDANAPGPQACIPAVTKNWQDALNYASCLNKNNYLGYSDWRIPSIREIGGLIDPINIAKLIFYSRFLKVI